MAESRGDGDRWSEIRRIFEQALDVDRAGRSAFVERACGGDDALRREVEQLLAADDDDTSGSPILDADTPPAMLAARGAPSRMLGAQVGSFRIVRVLGSGGMGTVFEAEQERPRRVVALKMLRLDLGTEPARRRFEYEAEILGRLRHPGIAQVLEAGTYDEDGLDQPYFAMELIDGARALDDYVRAHELELDEILDLVHRVCDAVHHGHQHGVIHRDLKPANILVDRSGQPKVIDFGIARATDADLAQATLLTQTGQILGTLRYVSPEQLDAHPAPLDTRVDVYALGVILFELLTGVPPFALAGLPLTTAARTVREDAPPRPSAVGQRPGSSVRTIPADLDWIVLRAMEKDPERRYGSASELAAELERYRRGEAVLAGPPSARYRIYKFVRRHRLAVGAAAFCVLALIAGTTATAIGWSRAVTAERLAESRRRQAEDVTESIWLVNQLLSAIQQRASSELDDELRARIDKLAKRLDDSTIDNTSVEAGMRNHLGVSYEQLGLLELGRAQYEVAMRLCRSQADPIDDVFIAVLNNLGLSLSNAGELDRAERLLRECLAEQVELLGDDHHDTARTLINLAGVLLRRGRHEMAAEHYERAFRYFLERHGPGGRATIAALRGRAMALSELGDHDEAEAILRRALDAANRHRGAANDQTLEIQNALAVLLQDTGKLDQAATLFAELAEKRARVLGETHPTTLAVYNNLGLNYEKQGEYAQAEQVFRKILAARRQAGLAGGVDGLIPRNNLVMVLYEQDDPEKLEECEELVLELIADAEAVLPTQNWRIAIFRKHYGVCLRKQGRFAEAETVLLAAARSLEATLGSTHRRTRSTLRDLVDLYEAWDRPADADRARARLESGSREQGHRPR